MRRWVPTENATLYCLTESPILQLFIPIAILTNCAPPPDLSKPVWNS